MSRLAIRLVFALLLLAGPGGSFLRAGEIDPFGEDVNRRNFGILHNANTLSEDQQAMLENLMVEQRLMVMLFLQHGLLSENLLRIKLAMIFEITAYKMNALLTDEQRALIDDVDKCSRTRIHVPRQKRATGS